MNGTRNVIRDGMTRRGRIDPVDRLHDALDFSYRPMLASEVEALATEVNTVGGEESIHLTAAAIVDHLAEWSEVDDKGKPLPLTFQNVHRLPFLLMNKLYGILAGTVASALVTTPSAQESSEYIDRIKQHAEGVTLIEQEDAAAGNSETG